MTFPTQADFRVGAVVSVSFSDVGRVIGYCIDCLVVELSDARGAMTESGMEYKQVIVHPSNITAELRMPRPHMARIGA